MVFNILFISSVSFGGYQQLDQFRKQAHDYCKRRGSDFSCQKANFQNLNETAFETLCHQFYQNNHCDEYKASISQGERSDVLSCSSNEVCQGLIELKTANCIIDGFKVQISFPNLLSISGGVAGAVLVGSSFAVATLVALPFVVYGGSKKAEECNKDFEYKRMAIRLHNLSLLSDERVLNFNDKALLNLECADLEKYLNTRLDALVGKRLEKSKWSMETQAAQVPAGQALLEILKSHQCLKESAILERYCRSLTSLATGIVLGGSLIAITKKGVSASGVRIAPSAATYTFPTKISSSTIADIRKMSAAMSPEEAESLMIQLQQTVSRRSFDDPNIEAIQTILAKKYSESFPVISEPSDLIKSGLFKMNRAGQAETDYVLQGSNLIAFTMRKKIDGTFQVIENRGTVYAAGTKSPETALGYAGGGGWWKPKSAEGKAEIDAGNLSIVIAYPKAQANPSKIEGWVPEPQKIEGVKVFLLKKGPNFTEKLMDFPFAN